MPMRRLKKDTSNSLTLEWVLHVKNFKLDLDKKKCVGCQICSLACPKEAIGVTKQPKAAGEKTGKPKVDIDLVKCNFCGICDVACPFGALRLTLNGEHVLSVVEKESFPQLTRDIKVDPTKMPKNTIEAENACPLGLIRMSFAGSGRSVKVDVDREHCPCCTVCETELPSGAVSVRRFISGKISVDQEKCPEGCRDCVDVCPIDGTLVFSHTDGKVHVNESSCVYCGTCKTVCPVDTALSLKRTGILHTPIRSGAWNKALERLTSSTDMTKELKSKGSMKARESVKKRMMVKETQVA